MRKFASSSFWLIAAVAVVSWLGVASAAPATIAPGTADSNDHFYVFGPQGSARSGAEDCLQVVFIRVPANAGQVSISILGPGSGGAYERRSQWISRAPDTKFTVYGGPGAWSDERSQSIRPTPDQPGQVLATNTYGAEPANEWVTVGPFDAGAGEVHGGYAYFKVVAQALNHSGANFFKVGVNVPNATVFAYDFTLHLVAPDQARQELYLASSRFYVASPDTVGMIRVHNYDMDDGGIPIVAGVELTPSKSGKWWYNEVRLQPGSAPNGQIPFYIRRGSQQFANAGFHITDGQGNPIAVVFTGDPVAGTARPAPATGGLISLRKDMPANVYLNEEMTMTLNVIPHVDVADVVVQDMMPDGLEYVRSDPAAQQNGKTLTWRYDSLDAGDNQTITVVARPTKEGRLVNCATIDAIPRLCVATDVGQPQLEIAKTGPDQVRLGERFEYTVTVRNTGTAMAENVVVTDTLPAGLSHADGQNLTFNVGNLAPGQSQTIAVPVTAEQRGRLCNRAQANAGNAAAVNAEACTLVVQPGIEIAKTGPTTKQYTPKTADYQITVRNTGDIDLTGVTVTDNAPNGTEVVKSSEGQVNGNTVTWNIGTLPKGQTKSFTVTLKGTLAGTHCNRASVTTNEGPSDNAEVCTPWIGHPAILIEVIDTDDPLLVGEETTYVIQITNQGTAPDSNVRIVAAFPAEITPIQAEGPTPTKIQGKTVTAEAYPELAPKKVLEWRIRAKADKTGDSRLKVQLFADLLETPVTEEESTHVY